MTRPLAIDLFTGLHGWASGLVDVGYHVVGYDIEDMCAAFGLERPEHGELVIQDVLTIHGSAFKDAALIVASPPCQFFSYTAMPWSKAKALAAEVRADPERLAKELALFNACFRIQREASEATGRHIPMVVENVRGAIPWVGRSRGSFGSFHLWGDVPALMPAPVGRVALKAGVTHGSDGTTNFHGFRAPGLGHGWKHPSDPRHTPGLDFTAIAGKHALSESGVKVLSAEGRRTDLGKGARFTSRDCGVERLHGVDHDTGTKIGGDWFSDPNSTCRKHGSKSNARKAASALIAKIPKPLSMHIGRVYWPEDIARREVLAA